MNLREERLMFGVTVAEMREMLEESITFKLSGPAMVIASMLSNAQEEIALGMNERARQTINQTKWILTNYMTKN